MRPKVAAIAGAAVVLALAGGAVLFWPDGEDKNPAGLSVPMGIEPSTEWTPSNPASMQSFIPPAVIETPAKATQETVTPPPPAESKTVAPPPAAPAAPNASGRISFYGARNNEPPGSRAIAYPNALHRQAGGAGTFEDPLTFAAGENKFKLGTKIYVPDVKRYFILEDLCPQCSGTQINLWSGSANDSGIIDCQKSLTREGARPYEVNPPSGRAVVPGDLYQDGRCYQP